MIKLHHYVCDRCRTVLESALLADVGKFDFFTSKKKKTKMHFCNEKCKLSFLKGKKYYNKKQKLQEEAFQRISLAADKCL